MKIEVIFEELLSDIKNKSHYEVASIQDVNLRYIAEAGTENEPEITRCIIEAEAMVRQMCVKFLNPDTTTDDNSLPESNPDKFVYDFRTNSRMQDNRGKVMANGIHSAIVSMALSKFYISVNQMELSKAHDALAQNALTLLERMLYEKRQPRLPE